MIRQVSLLRHRAAEPLVDTAISHAILEAVAAGSRPETLRLYTPDRIVAFGRQDTSRPGFGEAVRAAQAAGFTPIVRLAGGKAAVFHEATLAFSWAIPIEEPRVGIHERFRMVGDLLRDAFRSLGIDARIGEVPGEYCPGEWSVNVAGRRKLAGVGQRLVASAAHVGGVVVVGRSDLVNTVLTGVYSALGYQWDPSTTGALEEEAAVGTNEVAAAIEVEFGRVARLVEAPLDPATLARAHQLAPGHDPIVDTLA